MVNTHLTDKEITTESEIFRAARKVFMQKGFDGARMQEIADEAGINKALLHYYFRSKDNLFGAIFADVMKNFFPKILEVLAGNESLETKISLFVDRYIEFLIANPDIPGFVLHEVSRNPDRLMGNFRQLAGNLDLIKVQLLSQADNQHLKPVKIEHFIANLISMCIFPFIARPILGGIMQLNPAQYDAFIQERKSVIPEVMMQWLRQCE